jgi:SAM-dependent methyltransferase
MVKFSTTQHGFLPLGYGVALDERCIEWPWAMANLGDAARILDAGSALNHPHILSQPLWREKKLHIFTLAPESVCEWQRGISYVYGDLRKLPYQNEEFDCIVSISTLEHVGMDNSAFLGQENHKEHSTEDILLVLAEMRRVLKPDGRLLLTVPYGRYEDHGIFQQFDAALLERCAQHFAPAKRKELFFLYSEKGWQAVPQTDCDQSVYAINAPRSPEHDLAAAARGVACCQWEL